MTSQGEKKAAIIPSSLTTSICPTFTPIRHAGYHFTRYNLQQEWIVTQHYSPSRQDCTDQYLFCNLWRTECPLHGSWAERDLEVGQRTLFFLYKTRAVFTEKVDVYEVFKEK